MRRIRREFIAASLLEWLCEQGVRPVQVAKASPQLSAFIERFNGSMRDELLHREVVLSLTVAWVLIGRWVRHHNTERPHSGLQARTPAAFARYRAGQAGLPQSRVTSTDTGADPNSAIPGMTAAGIGRVLLAPTPVIMVVGAAALIALLSRV